MYILFGTGSFIVGSSVLSFNVPSGAKIVIIDLGMALNRLFGFAKSLPFSSLIGTSFRVKADSVLSGVKTPDSEFHFLPVQSVLKESISAL